MYVYACIVNTSQYIDFQHLWIYADSVSRGKRIQFLYRVNSRTLRVCSCSEFGVVLGAATLSRLRASRTSPHSACWKTPTNRSGQLPGAATFWPLPGTTRQSVSMTRIRTGETLGVRCAEFQSRLTLKAPIGVGGNPSIFKMLIEGCGIFVALVSDIVQQCSTCFW